MNHKFLTVALTEKLKNVGIALIVILFFSLGVYSIFFKKSDEIGYLGAGKVGRQVLIQTLDTQLDPNVDVDSEYRDRNIALRLVIGEPMRTTIKFDIRDTQEFKVTSESARALLEQPASVFSDGLDTFTLQEKYTLSSQEFRKVMSDKHVSNVEDLFAGYGFKNVQFYERGNLVQAIELKNVKNVIHIGG